MLNIETAMTDVADGMYETVIPYTTRKDEIGKIARRLDTFRMKLSVAARAQRESAFKSAAFEGSSAPMMMVDEDLRIIFLNPRCQLLLQHLGDNL